MDAIAEKPDQRPKKRDAATGAPRSLLDLTEAALRGLSLVTEDVGTESEAPAAAAGQEGGGDATVPAAAVPVPTGMIRDRREKKDEEEGDGGGGGGEGGEGEKLTCKTAPGVVFASRKELAEHCRGDWHRFNLKMLALGRPLVDEDAFGEMVEDLSSISGSDESTTNEDEEDVDEDERALEEVYRAQHSLPSGRRRSGSPDGGGERRARKTPFVRVEGGGGLGRFRVCSALVASGAWDAGDPEAVAAVQAQGGVGQLLSTVAKAKVTLLFASGGHFAGCVYQGRERVRSKTFHRYVIRAKAGTRQAVRDAMGGSSVPKSAGSSIRRHNEEALQRDINALLEVWGGDLGGSSLIFVHAPGSVNKASLFGSGALAQKDPRVRGVPFATRRPTLKELDRVHALLLGVHEDAAPPPKPPAPRPKGGDDPARRAPAAAPAEAEWGGLPREDPIFALCAKGNMPEVKRLVAAGESDVNALNASGRTPLHLAALSGPPRSVGFLLDLGADPGIRDDAGKVPYVLCRGKEERDAFRRFMGAHPDRWDYREAAVPSALTEEMEGEQQRKAEDKKEREKARRKEQERRKKEAERKRKEEAEAQQTASKATAQLTDRERRALAAERRLGVAPTSSPPFSCEMCGKQSTGGAAPFERLAFKYCSTACVVAHKKALGE